MKLFGIFGAGGAGRGVLPFVRDSLGHAGEAGEAGEAVFVDDARAGESINGARTLSLKAFSKAADKAICIAVADGSRRARIVQRCEDAGVPFFSALAQQRVQMDDVKLGIGALISPYTTLTSNICVGRHFHLNLYSYVEHDCRIGDFVTFAPAVRCNGNVTIADHAYVGSNAVIRQGVTIGEGAVIGMGAVVTRDVPPNETWAGNPARALKT
jgi:sugar O-acyltransferase (sialic acid O-acetyltransferase NeuD family)|tara:strand:- start:1461 stop:2096 length:636 start_codon:yes stop_codon:yes gene_type:complete